MERATTNRWFTIPRSQRTPDLPFPPSNSLIVSTMNTLETGADPFIDPGSGTAQTPTTPEKAVTPVSTFSSDLSAKDLVAGQTIPPQIPLSTSASILSTLSTATLNGSDEAVSKGLLDKKAGTGKDGIETESLEPFAVPAKRPWYKSPGFIAACCILAVVGIAVPVAVIMTRNANSKTSVSVASVPGALATKSTTSFSAAPTKTKSGAATATAAKLKVANPSWKNWYSGTFQRAAPNCDVLQQPSSSQPTLARFAMPMPAQPNPTMQVVVDLSDYGLNETLADNYQPLVKALAQCKTVDPLQGCRLTMPKGVYRFSTEKSISFDTLFNFTLSGNDSIWLFARKSSFSRLLSFHGCTNVRVEKLQIDWDWSVWRLASLVRVDWISGVPPGADGAMQLGLRFLDHPYLDLDTINSFSDMHAVDPDTLTVGVRDSNRQGQFWQLEKHVLDAQQLWNKEEATNNTVLITLDKWLSPQPNVGGLYLLRHFSYEGNALQFNRCQGVVVDRVKIWGAPGMALAFRPGTSNVRVTNVTIGILGNQTVENITRIVDERKPAGFFNVTLLPTTNETLSLKSSANFTVTHINIPALTRRISSTADALSFVGVTGHIHVEDVEAGWQGDDCSNANIPIVLGIDRMNETSAVTRILLKEWQKTRTGGFAAGDVLEFRNMDYSPTGVTRTVIGEPYWISTTGWVVDLQGPKLPKKDDGYKGKNGESWWTEDGKLLAFNLRFNVTASILYRRLHCHSNRSRGILFQLPVGGVEYSCFSNIQKRALSVTAEVSTGHWAEGTGVRDFYFSKNRVQKCDKLDDYLGTVWTGVIMPDGWFSSYPLLRNLRFTDNVFADFPRRSLIVSSAETVQVSGNRFFNDQPNDPEAWERGQVFVERAGGVRVEWNTWGTAAFTRWPLVQVDWASVWDVAVGEGNVVS